MITKSLGFSFTIYLLFFLGAPVSFAAPFTVNVTNDPDPVAAPNGCSDPGINGGRCSLREAVLSANFVSDNDTIILGEAVYQLTRSGVDDNATAGDLDFTQVGSSVAVQGEGMDKTVIDAAIMADGIFQFNAINMTLSLTGMNLRNGKRLSDNGGAVGLGSTGDVVLHVADCRFEGNQAVQGGAIAWTNSSEATISGSVFTANNRSTGPNEFEGGGAIRIGESSSMTIENTLISGNRSAGDGGGLFAVNSARVTMNRVDVVQNQAVLKGGGIYSSSGPLIVFDTGSILDNQAADGGGFFVLNGSLSEEYRFDHLTIAGNRAANDGGAVHGGSGPHLTFLATTISGNTAGHEGGGFFSLNGLTVNLDNSTVSGNSAALNGGGISGEFGAAFNLRNATLFNNTAENEGGGIFSKDLGFNVTTANSVIAGNKAGGAPSDCDGVPVGMGLNFTSGNYNVFGEIGGCGVTTATNDQSGVNDPGLKPLADNGGDTETHLPEIDSPVVDRGNPGGCLDSDGSPLTVDQRGQTRPVGAACDVGAVELGESDLGIAKSADPNSVALGANLTYSLTVTNHGPDDNFQVSVTDALPAGLAFVSATPAQGACDFSGGAALCQMGLLPAGASTTVDIVVTADAEGTITNTASVTGSERDPEAANDSASVDVLVTGGEDGGGGGCALDSGAAGLDPNWGWGFLPVFLLTLGIVGRMFNPGSVNKENASRRV